MTKPQIVIARPNDDRIEIQINGETIASANHDEHGWSGMEAVEQTALAVAKAAGVAVGEQLTEIEEYAISLLRQGGESIAEDDMDEDGHFESEEDWRAACDLSIEMAHAIRDNAETFLAWFRKVSA